MVAHRDGELHFIVSHGGGQLLAVTVARNKNSNKMSKRYIVETKRENFPRAKRLSSPGSCDVDLDELLDVIRVCLKRHSEMLLQT